MIEVTATDPEIDALLDDWEGRSLVPRLAAGDANLWGAEAQAEASQRLGWLELPQDSLDRLRQWEELAAARADLRRVALAGMGGSSLGAEVVASATGVSVVTVDTTDPAAVQHRLLDQAAETLLVVASKSGSTVETNAHRQAFEQTLADTGMDATRRARHIVVVTDPGSPLEQLAQESGWAVVHGRPDVGGRFSVLSAFGLLAPMLAGAAVRPLLEEAARLRPALSDPRGDVARLGAALALAARRSGQMAPRGGSSFPDWAEQLVAESSGKLGTGLLPVVGNAPLATTIGDDAGAEVRVAGPLGAQFLAWEFATALLCAELGVNAFDQPDVQRAKAATSELLAAGSSWGSDYWDAGAAADELTAFVDAIPSGGYLAILAFLDPEGDSALQALQDRLQARRRDISVTFGWGPRYLHSTGQYHKGGPAVGSYLFVTGTASQEVCGGYRFADLQRAQALGDMRVLQDLGRPTLHVHLGDRESGIEQLLQH
jgi:glucose-6-phosphate isomerase